MILQITGCSKRKKKYPDKVSNFYAGDIFLKSKIFSEKYKNIDLWVISGKYGLIPENEVVFPYNHKLTTKKDIHKIQTQAIFKLNSIITEYNAIFLILSNKYLEVIAPVLENSHIPVFRLISKNGIFDYKKNMMKLLNDEDFSVISQIHGPEKKNLREYLKNA